MKQRKIYKTIKPDLTSDFNQIDQALILFLIEQYKALHLHTSVATQTANRMLQFLAVATAAFGALAITFFIKNKIADMAMCGALLLMLPITIEILYLIWIREQLRILRNSVFLLGLERRISHYVYLMAPKFRLTSKPGRAASYATIDDIFGHRFMDWEIWVRGQNKKKTNFEEKGIYLVIILVFFAVAFISDLFGMTILSSIYEEGCDIISKTVISQSANFSSAKPFQFMVRFIEGRGNILAGIPFWQYSPRECVFEPVYTIIGAFSLFELVLIAAILLYTLRGTSILKGLAAAEERAWSEDREEPFPKADLLVRYQRWNIRHVNKLTVLAFAVCYIALGLLSALIARITGSYFDGIFPDLSKLFALAVFALGLLLGWPSTDWIVKRWLKNWAEQAQEFR